MTGSESRSDGAQLERESGAGWRESTRDASSLEQTGEAAGGVASAEAPSDLQPAHPPSAAGAGDPVHPVRRLREQLLMTREELAARAGVSLRTIWSVEHGRSCRTPTKRRILKALGVAKTRHHEIFLEG